ncbi:MAG: hypothetical protein ACI4DP_03225 [Candidatus Ornithomonoglobus sp.]
MRSKKILSGLLAAMSAMSVAGAAFAADVEITTAGGSGQTEVILTVEEPAALSVTVPMALPLTVDSAGVVTVATDAYITNNSNGQVYVTDVTIEGANSWEVVDYTTDMAKEAVGSKKFGFELMGDVTGVDGTLGFKQTSYAVMNGKSVTDDSNKINLEYDAVLPAQSRVIDGETIANITFTVDWFDTTSVQTGA